MKASIVAFAATFLGLVQAAPAPQLDLSALGGMAGMMGGGIASGFTRNMINGGYGKTGFLSGSGTAVPMAARFSKQVPNSKTVKMRYGPYSVPNMNHKTPIVNEDGALWNYPDTSVNKPCEKCVVVGMNAGLEYPSGKVANIDTGAWLHHFVLFNIGPGRSDATCYGKPSLPHANVDSSPSGSERMFSSGNERTPAFMSDWAGGGTGALKPVGYHIKPSDKFAMIVDLMNDSKSDFTAYLTITFDYLDGWPAGYDDMRPIWFDIDQCGLSEKQPYAQSGAFSIKAWGWSATLDGEILGYAGHLHDGGQRVTLAVDGQDVCSSKATYGGDPAYSASMSGMASMNMKSATTHISHMSICQGPTLNTKYMKRGQNWVLTADYDYNKNKGVLEDSGFQAPIMGIAIMYVRQPWSDSGSGGGGLFGGLFGKN